MEAEILRVSAVLLNPCMSSMQQSPLMQVFTSPFWQGSSLRSSNMVSAALHCCTYVINGLRPSPKWQLHIAIEFRGITYCPTDCGEIIKTTALINIIMAAWSKVNGIQIVMWHLMFVWIRAFVFLKISGSQTFQMAVNFQFEFESQLCKIKQKVGYVMQYCNYI